MINNVGFDVTIFEMLIDISKIRVAKIAALYGTTVKKFRSGKELVDFVQTRRDAELT